MSYAETQSLVDCLYEGGHPSHAHKIIQAWDQLQDNLEDEAEDAPDWRPLLDEFRRLEAEGRQLLGWTS